MSLIQGEVRRLSRDYTSGGSDWMECVRTALSSPEPQHQGQSSASNTGRVRALTSSSDIAIASHTSQHTIGSSPGLAFVGSKYFSSHSRLQTDSLSRYFLTSLTSLWCVVDGFFHIGQSVGVQYITGEQTLHFFLPFHLPGNNPQCCWERHSG